MKRHPSLVHLSREHHGALLLARLLQKGAPDYPTLPADTAGKAGYAINFYKHELVKHFEEEEKVLKMVTGVNDILDQLVLTIIREHLELHQAFISITGHPDITAHLNELGVALEIHVRKEERELFPLIEKTCSDRLMEEIAKLFNS